MVRGWSRGTALAILAFSLAGCSLENQLVYHPVASKPGDTPVSAKLAYRDLFLKSEDGNQIHARWFGRADATGAILYCSGNAGNLEQRTPRVSELAAELGLSLLIFDYPGYGRSQGQPSEKGCYAAATTAYECLTHDKGIQPSDIVIYGESLGGGVAVDLASRKPHRALVLARTFTSIPDVAQAHSSLPVRWLMQNRFDSLEKIKKCPGPVFIAYADQDRLIPAGEAQQLKAACPGRCELFLLKGLGHNDPPGADFYTALRHFLGAPN